MPKILATAKQNLSAKMLAPVIEELQNRGHEIIVYATGSAAEAQGFGKVPYHHIDPSDDSYSFLVKGCQAVLVGLSGKETPDGHFLRAANAKQIPTMAVLEQNHNYTERLYDDNCNLPNILAVVDETCRGQFKRNFQRIGTELEQRIRVVGWTAFDHYARLREEFSEKDAERIKSQLQIAGDREVYFHATQNIHPDSEYMKRITFSPEEKRKIFEYEMNVTQSVFQAAADLGLQLTVKPHPGEAYTHNFTRELAEKFNFQYYPADACSTIDLMLTSSSVTAGRSTCLTEACLLDRSVGGILPDSQGREWAQASPAVALKAIPYTHDRFAVSEIIQMAASPNLIIQKVLVRQRKQFSVDGKASQRAADLVESILS